MAEYINKCDVSIGEVARLRFSDNIHQEDYPIIELVCPIEFLPMLSRAIQESYDGFKQHLVNEKAARETNKKFS